MKEMPTYADTSVLSKYKVVKGKSLPEDFKVRSENGVFICTPMYMYVP